MPGGPGGDYGTKEQSRQHPKHFPASPPRPVLRGLSSASLRRSKEIRCIQKDMAVGDNLSKSTKHIIVIFLVVGRE